MGQELRRGPHSAAHTAGALTLATGAALAAELAWAAFRPLPQFADVDASGVLDAHLDGPPLRVLVLGDSTLTGPGLDDPDDIWVRQAIAGLRVGRPVHLTSAARGGSRVADVRAALPAALDAAGPADVAVVAVGANDAIHGSLAAQFARDYDTLLLELLDAVPRVAVANVGDLGNIVRFAPPLRAVMRRRGRQFGRIIEAAVARHHGVVLLDVTPANEHFRDRTLFGPDLFHPNRDGHARWAEAAGPGLALALGLTALGVATG